MDTAIAGYKSYLSCLKDIFNAGIIIASGVWNKGDVKRSDAIKKAYELLQGGLTNRTINNIDFISST